MRALLQVPVNLGLRLILRIIAKADTGEFSKIPDKGPFIIIFNHVNFLEVPLLYLRLLPRKVHYMAKRETWETPFLGWVATNWEAIPVERGSDPREAFSRAADYLSRGEIILMSPEGTRSEDGVLRRGRAGAAILALENDVPILPVVHCGAEKIRTNLRHLRRTRVSYRVGEAFRLETEVRPDRESRIVLADSLMRKMAVLLPEELRGQYKP